MKAAAEVISGASAARASGANRAAFVSAGALPPLAAALAAHADQGAVVGSVSLAVAALAQVDGAPAAFLSVGGPAALVAALAKHGGSGSRGATSAPALLGLCSALRALTRGGESGCQVACVSAGAAPLLVSLLHRRSDAPALLAAAAAALHALVGLRAGASAAAAAGALAALSAVLTALSSEAPVVEAAAAALLTLAEADPSYAAALRSGSGRGGVIGGGPGTGAGGVNVTAAELLAALREASRRHAGRTAGAKAHQLLVALAVRASPLVLTPTHHPTSFLSPPVLCLQGGGGAAASTCAVM